MLLVNVKVWATAVAKTCVLDGVNVPVVRLVVRVVVEVVR